MAKWRQAPVASYSPARRECVVRLRTNWDCISFINGVVDKMKRSRDGSVVLRIKVEE